MDQHPTQKYSYFQLLYGIESMEPKVLAVGLTIDEQFKAVRFLLASF